jgi:hypothetical protein
LDMRKSEKIGLCVTMSLVGDINCIDIDRRLTEL